MSFTGKWKTRDGTVVKVTNNLAEVLETDKDYLKSMRFPIDEKGNCIISPNFDLVERIRDSEGYML